MLHTMNRQWNKKSTSKVAKFAGLNPRTRSTSSFSAEAMTRTFVWCQNWTENPEKCPGSQGWCTSGSCLSWKRFAMPSKKSREQLWIGGMKLNAIICFMRAQCQSRSFMSHCFRSMILLCSRSTFVLAVNSSRGSAERSQFTKDWRPRQRLYYWTPPYDS